MNCAAGSRVLLSAAQRSDGALTGVPLRFLVGAQADAAAEARRGSAGGLLSGRALPEHALRVYHCALDGEVTTNMVSAGWQGPKARFASRSPSTNCTISDH